MREPSTFSALLARIAAILETGGIPYMVIGGHAAVLYGEPRLTRDIDITLGVGQDVLIHKIVAGRPRDIEDARAILAKTRTFDRPYLLRWLQEFEATLSSPLVSQFLELERQVNPS